MCLEYKNTSNDGGEDLSALSTISSHAVPPTSGPMRNQRYVATPPNWTGLQSVAFSTIFLMAALSLSSHSCGAEGPGGTVLVAVQRALGGP